MTIPTLTVTPAGAAQAYARVAGGGTEDADAPGTGFGAALGQALGSVVQAGRDADAQSLKALSGGGNVTEVALAVSHAELALQGAVAVRDKVVQAYQDIMRMPI